MPESQAKCQFAQPKIADEKMAANFGIDTCLSIRLQNSFSFSNVTLLLFLLSFSPSLHFSIFLLLAVVLVVRVLVMVLQMVLGLRHLYVSVANSLRALLLSMIATMMMTTTPSSSAAVAAALATAMTFSLLFAGIAIVFPSFVPFAKQIFNNYWYCFS